MQTQNIYDNEAFFKGYRKLRENAGNANDLFEKPALFALLPDLKGKAVLDLGCGFGEHCMEYIRAGAQRVVGIDVSEKMLAIARAENQNPRITYRKLAIEKLPELSERFDVVTSSLALHYVQDFRLTVRNVYAALKDRGVFVFSQEHPLGTAYSGGERWTRDRDGNKRYVNLADYGLEGEREVVWLAEHVQIYHRTFSTIVNALADAGFAIEKMTEPLPTQEILERYPKSKDLFHKPDFLLIRARKLPIS